MLVRTWNLFHGRTFPTGRRAYLREMVELATADGPDVVCLQEVPVWSLRHLARWSGMTAVGALTVRPLLRSAEVGRWLTALHHGLIRSAVSGQANAILVASRYRVDGEAEQVVSRRGERRVVQVLRLDGRVLVANVHVTGGAPADEQFGAVVDFAESRGADEVILAGDANLRPEQGGTYERLQALGYSAPLPGSIDQILVRGLPSGAPTAWPADRRRRGNRVLSDHAPVELRVG